MGIRDIKTAEDKILRAIIDLQKPQPFFAHLLARMQPTPMPPKDTAEGKRFRVRTAGVNAKGKLWYDRDWIMTCSEEEMKGLMCHEVFHVAFLHPLRTGRRDHNVANIAQDIEANYFVQGAGLQLPKGSVPVDTGSNTSSFNIGKRRIHIDKVSEKAWEELYEDIWEQLEGDAPSGNPGGGFPGWDDHLTDDDGEPLTPEEKAAIEKDWQQALADAATYAKQQGKLPSSMQRLIDGLLKPKVYWPQYLLKYLRPHLHPVDWSYAKPHKKSQQLGVYMPNVVKEHCEVEVQIDTSGSISGELIKEFMTEVMGIAKAHPRMKLHVQFVDTEPHGRYSVTNANVNDILAMKPAGGGGTCMESGLDHIKKVNREASVVVVLTDGYDSWSRKAKDYPFDVIWCLSPDSIPLAEAKQRIPYGAKIKMEA